MKLMQFTLWLVALCVSHMVFAAKPGAYLGAGIGGSRIDTPDDYLFNVDSAANADNSKEIGGLGGKVFAGYNLNQYFGIELNYADYARSLYTANIGENESSIKYSMSAASLVGKTYLPFGTSGFSFYALAGGAQVFNKVQVKDGGIPFVGNPIDDVSPSGTTSTYKLRPVFGTGITYDFSERVSSGLEYTHIQGEGDVKVDASAIADADMVALNLAYHFG